MTSQEWLLKAAKRAKRLLEAQARGQYHGPTEDLQTGRELAAAIAAVEQEQAEQEMVSRR